MTKLITDWNGARTTLANQLTEYRNSLRLEILLRIDEVFEQAATSFGYNESDRSAYLRLSEAVLVPRTAPGRPMPPSKSLIVNLGSVSRPETAFGDTTKISSLVGLIFEHDGIEVALARMA